MGGYFLLDMFQNEVCHTNRAVNTQLPEDFFVLGVINSRDGPGHTEFIFSYLAGYQIVLIPIRSCYENFRPGCPHLSQCSYFTAVTSDTHASQLILKVFTLSAILIHHQYLVPLLQKCFTQIIA